MLEKIELLKFSKMLGPVSGLRGDAPHWKNKIL